MAMDDDRHITQSCFEISQGASVTEPDRRVTLVFIHAVPTPPHPRQAPSFAWSSFNGACTHAKRIKKGTVDAGPGPAKTRRLCANALCLHPVHDLRVGDQSETKRCCRRCCR